MQVSPNDTSPLPPTTVVGRGRVGNALGRALGATLGDVAMAGRDEVDDACADAEIVLLCVPDAEIGAACERVTAVAPMLRFLGHTSGATRLEVLAPAAERGIATFSLHPLQTIPDLDADLTGAHAAIAGSDSTALALARELAESCQMSPFEVPEEARAAYHAAASIASNFLVTLEAGAEDLLAAAGIEDGRQLLAPLVLRTAANWAEHGPAALTGPIARGDEKTVQRQLDAIEEVAPELADTYRALAERTRAVAATGDRR